MPQHRPPARSQPRPPRTQKRAPPDRSEVALRLLHWFARHGRDLPWRGSSDPYRIWVSEIMLQQTQVDRVSGFFTRFIDRFPDVESLSRADEEEVLRSWEGLGYYRRARQLHAAARLVVAKYGGVLPTDADRLRGLPGIGRYTANAIASIAFGARVPIIEANSRRVLARLTGHDRPLAGSAGDGPLWKVAEQLVPAGDPGRFNQALMDLGALRCTPTRPRCGGCPLATACEARRTNRQEVIPLQATRPQVRRLKETALVLRRRGRVLLQRRGAGEWWEGLWDFPRLPAGGRLPDDRRLGIVTYSVTRHRVTCTVVERRPSGRLPAASSGRWIQDGMLERLPLASPARRIAGLLTGSSGR